MSDHHMFVSYYRCLSALEQCGYDGLLGFEESFPPFNTIKAESIEWPEGKVILSITENGCEKIVKLRRGAQFCELIMDDYRLLFFVSENLFKSFNSDIEQDGLNIQSVVIVKSKKQKNYFAFNPLIIEAYSQIVDYRNSNFKIAHFSKLYSKLEQIGRVFNGFDGIFEFIKDLHSLSSPEEYLDLWRENWWKQLVPINLCLKIDHFPLIFNFDRSQTFFREDFALALSQARMPGVRFPGPPITVSLTSATPG